MYHFDSHQDTATAPDPSTFLSQGSLGYAGEVTRSISCRTSQVTLEECSALSHKPCRWQGFYFTSCVTLTTEAGYGVPGIYPKIREEIGPVSVASDTKIYSSRLAFLYAAYLSIGSV